MNNTLEFNRPLHFSLDIEDQENERFVKLPQEIAKGKHYEISNLGRVKSFSMTTVKILSPYKTCKQGYFHVRLKGFQWSVKSLVYIAFIGKLEPWEDVAFIDGNECNITVNNLRKRYLESMDKRKESNKVPMLVHLKINYPVLPEIAPMSINEGINIVGHGRSFLNKKNNKFPEPLQKGEEVKELISLGRKLLVSNRGLVQKVLDTQRGIRFKTMKLTQPSKGSSFYVSAGTGKNQTVECLVYLAFVGDIPEDKKVWCKDENRANLTPENLCLKPSWYRFNYREQKVNPKTKKQIKKMEAERAEKEIFLTLATTAPEVKLKEITIDLNMGDKEAKLRQMKVLRKQGYILSKSDNGIYYYCLKTL